MFNFVQLYKLFNLLESAGPAQRQWLRSSATPSQVEPWPRRHGCPAFAIPPWPLRLGRSALAILPWLLCFGCSACTAWPPWLCLHHTTSTIPVSVIVPLLISHHRTPSATLSSWLHCSGSCCFGSAALTPPLWLCCFGSAALALPLYLCGSMTPLPAAPLPWLCLRYSVPPSFLCFSFTTPARTL